MTAPMLQAENLRWHVAGRDILSVPKLFLARREVLAVVEPNGVGKSSLLLILALLQEPTASSASTGKWFKTSTGWGCGGAWRGFSRNRICWTVPCTTTCRGRFGYEGRIAVKQKGGRRYGWKGPASVTLAGVRHGACREARPSAPALRAPSPSSWTSCFSTSPFRPSIIRRATNSSRSRGLSSEEKRGRRLRW